MTFLITVLTILAFSGHQRVPAPVALGEPFCGSPKVVRDFGLSQLPGVQEPPRSGRLPFGPKNVSLGGYSDDPILRSGESYGYELSSEKYRGHTPLNWTLSARMVRVDKTGRWLREVDRKTIRVRIINYDSAPTLYLKPPNPGFYLYDLRIVGNRRSQRVHYQRYLRVVRKFWNVRLGLSQRRFKPGQTVLSRIENLGSERASFGDGVGVQRRVGDRWVRARDMPPVFLEMWEAWTSPGETAGCIPLSLPADFRNGQYRMVKRVGKAGGKGGAWLTAPFEVVGHAPWMEQAEAALFHLYGRPGVQRLAES